jgi:hemolysin activation/secretion protein
MSEELVRRMQPGGMFGMIKRHCGRIGAGVALICGLGLLMPTLASAQSAAQRFPGVIDRPVPEVPLPPAPRALPPLGGTPTPESVPDANAPVPTITSVQFSGNNVLSNAQLQKVAAPYLNRPLTRGDLAKFKYDVAKRYYASGYILVRVVTPPNQDLSKGVLNVTVYEAKIEKIETGKDAAVRPFITRAITSEVRPGSVFNETDVESMVRDLDDLHGAKASVNLVPGSQVGTTDLEVKVEKTNDFQQQVSVNNYGSKLTGEWLFNGNFQYGNLLGLGELYTFDFTHSDSSLLTVRGGIQTPIGIRNVILDTSYLYSNSNIGDRLAVLGSEGTTDQFRIGLSSALLNTAMQKITVRLGFDAGHFQSSILDGTPESDDKTRHVTQDMNYLLRLANTTVYAALQLSEGVSAFDGSSEGDTLLSRAQGNPDAFILRPTLFARQNLWTNGSVKGLVSGQYSGSTLLASDLFAIGGYGSVRGFQPAEETGESGMQVSVALEQEVLQREGWGVSIGPWFDGGWVWNKVPGAAVDDALYSVGLGGELHTNITTLGDTALRLDWAHPVGSYNDTTISSDTFYLQLLQDF